MKLSKFTLMLIALVSVVFCFNVYAGTVSVASGQPSASRDGLFIMVNGNRIPIDGLKTSDKQDLVKLLAKVQDSTTKPNTDVGVSTSVVNASDTVTSAIKNNISDPDKLRNWVTTFTTLIKDGCTTLNVSVNEFAKTPVGLFVAAMIFYRIAGQDTVGLIKDTVSDTLDIFIMVPLWIIVLFIIWRITKRFFGTEIIYDKVIEHRNEKGKVVAAEKSGAKVVSVYPWKETETGCSEARGGLAVGLFLSGIAMTATMLVVVFV